MDKAHILIIEDDPSICGLLLTTLSQSGYRVSVTHRGEDALLQIEEDPPRAVILDLNLPGMNGLDICRYMRRDPWMNKIPVLMLTAQAEEDDILTGLEVGADDYMTKPFSTKMLDARLKALLRRGNLLSETHSAGETAQVKSEPELLFVRTLGKCELCIGNHRLFWAEEFSPSQRQLLSLLVGSVEGKVAQEKLQASLWPESPTKKARSSIDTLLSRVRHTLDEKLKPFDSKRYLVVKRGYLCLENARVDALEFLRLVKKGRRQVSGKEYWPAEISFSSAFSLWQGPFIPANFGLDEAVNFQNELEQVYLEASLTFAALLAENKRYQQAAKHLREALRYDPTNDDLVRLLYRLALIQENPAQASQVLKHYQESLAKESFAHEEIHEILKRFPKTVSRSGWLVSG